MRNLIIPALTKHLLLLALLWWLPAWTSADIVVVTNLENPVASLSTKEVRKVFLGRLHLYPGTEHEPLAIDQPQGSDAYREFYDVVIGISLPKLKRYRAYYLFSGKGKVPYMADSQQAVVDSIQRSTFAIGYLVQPDKELLSKVKVVYRQSTPPQ
ncbi:MAG: hypothetical protein CMK89_04245 [Pseudomonadales bacterium]|nr:hypothetical protein [Pseudomonadales bacterium]